MTDAPFRADPRPVFESPRAAELLAAYYERDKSGAPRFTGSAFDSWAGGGDRAAVCDAFTSDDVVAVTYLSMRLHWTLVWDLLEGRARTLSELLSAVPTDVRLWDEDHRVSAALKAATTLWRYLRDVVGAGPVTSHKLLARKRPLLLPVYDSVVRSAVAGSDEIWLPLRRWLQADGNLQLLRDTREAASAISRVVPYALSELRVFDIVLWMEHSGVVADMTAEE